ncbi:MAG: diadenylate cyclase CdaA [Flavobacteriaceae bacterium]|nr:diadenylate cyclase CdaA [Flavobacteriaceae bacterium]
MIDFLHFSILDALDILLVAFLLYYIYKLLKNTVAINIFIGIAFIVLIWKITVFLEMEMLSGLLGTLISVGAIAILIVFQPEVRKFLLMLGTTNITHKNGFLRNLIPFKSNNSNTKSDVNIKEIVKACMNMSSTKTGALIVLERSQNLDFVTNSGDKMNIEVNSPILESIFYKNSPLHDGAIIIRKNTIVATRVVLPLSKKILPGKFGLRHRASVGITEKTDAICLIVSEETGAISYSKDGEILSFTSKKDFQKRLLEDLE